MGETPASCGRDSRATLVANGVFPSSIVPPRRVFLKQSRASRTMSPACWTRSITASYGCSG